ncbi:uncharacterized protein N7482_007574 [Penicillium canariense]|uniref:Nucleoside phosphorylase domain-containing protein n=1 Tax=Penicillium canariense TaxID=189055 RepID=A0A9W9I1Y9_9EURO|nr:uncharacterized protein N7482_007574 [Penicillium canariense]KAJ5160570.1 hypothetical protein N7482_007574 [Penicillium canariense]
MANSQPPSFANEEYVVGWICALPVEMAAAKGMMDEEHGEPRTPPADADQNTYILGSMGKFKIAVACLPMHQVGTSSAAVAARDMLFTFPNIRIGLLVGIGAGVPDENNDIRLGDVVLSSDAKNGGVITYDFGKKLADGSFESISALNRPPRSLATALGKLKAEHEMRENKILSYVEEMLRKYPFMRKRKYSRPEQALDQLFRYDYLHVQGATCATCDPSKAITREQRFDDNPLIHFGTIASGNTVVKDAIMREEIKEKHGAICLEMEAAGIMNNFPCIVIRGISDYADSHKNDDWQPFAAAAAAACAKEFLEQVQPKAVDGEPAAKDTLKKVHDEVLGISKFVTTEQTWQILQWITHLDFVSQQNDMLSRRQEGTGLWLIGSQEFEQWLSQSRKTLFCPGIPGAGKTVMSSIIIDHLNRRFADDPNVHIAWIFCSYQPHQAQTTLDLLLSLLKQLALKGSSVAPHIVKLYSQHNSQNTRPNQTEVQVELLKLAKDSDKVFIVMDALDEYCSWNLEEMQQFLSAIFRLQQEANVSIFATSRFNSDITSLFPNSVSKEIRAQQGDILTYVNNRMPRLLLSNISGHTEVQEQVRRSIVKAADGMYVGDNLLIYVYVANILTRFLLAKLHMDHLMGCPSVGDLEEALSTLPYGQKGLFTAYDQAISRIQYQKEAFRRMAFRALSWLTFSKRALYAQELQHALGTRSGDKTLNKKFLPAIEIMDSLCAGLVVLDRESGTIRLVHYTTKEYLAETHVLHDAEVEITKTSLTYLSFDEFSSGRCSNKEDFGIRLQIFPLFHYCAENWGFHASAALKFSAEIKSVIHTFLDKTENISAASQAMMYRSFRNLEGSHWLSVLPRRLTKVHLAAHFGLTDILEIYLDSNDDMDSKESRGMSPLAYAAHGGWFNAAKTLLDSRRVDPNATDRYRWTPLLLALSAGHERIVELLYSHGACLDIEDMWGYSPLCHAARIGHIELMRFCLNNGAEINSRCSPKTGDEGTPLMLARCSGNNNAVLFLLEKGANPDYPNEHGTTPLSAAAREGDEEVAKLLLEWGAAANPIQNLGTTPLFHAVWGGHDKIVKLLLVANGNTGVGQVMMDGLLRTASGVGQIKTLQHLLEYGAELNPQDQHSETALLAAAREGHEESVRYLLQSGADPTRRNKSGENALLVATKHNHVSVVNLLLEAGIEVGSQDITGNTALFFAAESGSDDIQKETPMHMALW